MAAQFELYMINHKNNESLFSTLEPKANEDLAVDVFLPPMGLEGSSDCLSTTQHLEQSARNKHHHEVIT